MLSYFIENQNVLQVIFVHDKLFKVANCTINQEHTFLGKSKFHFFIRLLSNLKRSSVVSQRVPLSQVLWQLSRLTDQKVMERNRNKVSEIPYFQYNTCVCGKIIKIYHIAFQQNLDQVYEWFQISTRHMWPRSSLRTQYFISTWNDSIIWSYSFYMDSTRGM